MASRQSSKARQEDSPIGQNATPVESESYQETFDNNTVVVVDSYVAWSGLAELWVYNRKACPSGWEMDVTLVLVSLAIAALGSGVSSLDDLLGA